MAYAAAMVACVFTWLRAGRDLLLKRLAAVLAIAEAALFFDVMFNWRWAIHGWLESQFQAHSLYDRRRGVQEAILALLTLAVLLVLRRVFRHLRGRPWAVSAAFCASLSLALWCVEVISLHQIDRILYAKAGPMMVIAWLWLLLCLLTAASLTIASAGSRDGREKSAER